MILVDSCVLIDVIEADAVWGDWSLRQLEHALLAGGLAINLVVYGEIAKSFDSLAQLDAFVTQVGLVVEPIPRAAVYVAAQVHLAYRRNKGSMVSTLPDFFIGAHAAHAGYPVLTRDRKRFSTYFPDLTLICP